MTLLCVVAVGGYGFFALNRDTASTPGDTTRPTTSGPQVTTKTDNVLVLPGGDPPTLDPALASDATSATYIVEIFSGLVRLNTDLEVVPDLASEWQVSDDGTLYTFTLRSGATFANGSPITADDFKYTFERACNPATQSVVADTYLGDVVGCRDKLRGQAGEVSGVRVVDAQTLAIQIDAPKVYFLSKLTYPTAFVVDQETVEAGGALWASENPNGSGPFMLENYTFGEQLLLRPNPNFYGDPKPSVEQVRFILAAGSAMTLYETDEIDLVGVGLADLDRVLDTSSPLNRDLREVASMSIGYIGLNAQQPPFEDARVRQAFNLAIDKEALTEVVIRDIVQPAYGILPPGMPGHNPAIEGLRFDPARAQQLLAESSYGGAAGLPPITLNVSGAGGAAGEEIEAIVEMWRQNLGVEVAIEQTESASFLAQISQRPNPYQSFALGWIADYPDPQNFLDIHFHCDSLDNKTNYCNEQVDSLLEAARVEPDEARRLELYRQAETLVVQDGAWVPLWFNEGYLLVKPWVTNYLTPAAIVPHLQYVEIEQ